MGDFDFQRAFDRVHERIDDVHRDVIDRIGSIQEESTETRTKVELLVGNGRPGKVNEIEEQIGELNEFKNKALGYLAAVGAAMTVVGAALHFAVDYITKK